MDPALKQRLIGAAVLVALAVIFLPMLVKGPAPDGGASHVPLDLPAEPDRRFETRELPLLPQPRAPEGGVTGMQPLDDDPNRIVTVDADDADRSDALTGEDMRQDAVGSMPGPAPAPAAPEPEPIAQAPAEQPAPQPAPQPAEEPAPAPLPATTAGGGFAVNLGSYANLANARELVQRLNGAGLSATAEPVDLDGREGLRVRLGPFAQRADAEAARQRALAVRSDLPASVISVSGGTAAASAPPTASAGSSPAPAPAPAAAAATGFAVQVGAFRSRDDAAALVSQLRGQGFTVFSEQVQTANGELHRVRVGPELDRAAAERLKQRLPAPYSGNGLIVSHP